MDYCWKLSLKRDKWGTWHTDKRVGSQLLPFWKSVPGMFRDNLSVQASQQLSLLQNKLNLVQLDPASELDIVLWKQENNGVFSVKLFHKFIKMGPHIHSVIRNIWRLWVPPRMQIFTWIMLQNKILTTENLKEKMPADNRDVFHVQK